MPDLLEELETGPTYRFRDFPRVAEIPRAGAIVYTIWDQEAALVYVGVSGRNPNSRKGPWGRLRSHWNGKRSGDQFCVYVADHYVLPALNPDQVAAISAPEPTLYMDDLTARVIRENFSFRFVAVDDFHAALALETKIKGGVLRAGPPQLNPPRARRLREID